MSQRIFLEVVFVACALSFASAAKPNVMFVHSGGLETPDANSAPSWANAYKYLQDALEDANSSRPVEIRVAYGVYVPDRSAADPNGSGNHRATFRLISGVTLKGGYAGPEMPDPNERCVEVFTTILSGDLEGNDSSVADPCDWANDPNRRDNSFHVIHCSTADDSAVIDGFTVTGGNANGSWFDGLSRGAGLYNGPNSGPTVKNCTFVDNWAIGACAEGAGMYNDTNSSPTVERCTFSANRVFGATARGGAICNGPYSNPDITNCIFSKNAADGATPRGAGMYNDAASAPNLVNCTFSDNRVDGASAEGGAVYNDSNSAPIVKNCIFWGDTPDEISPKGEPADVNYCDIQGGWSQGNGDNLSADPCFADAGAADYHLKSRYGRWDTYAYIGCRKVDLNSDGAVNLRDFSGFAGLWGRKGRGLPADLDTDGDVDACDVKMFSENYLDVNDSGHLWVCDVTDPNEDSTSLCIDAGDPDSREWRQELWPHGQRINIGAYGGTPEASMSSSNGSSIFDLADPNNIINFTDFAVLAKNWHHRGPSTSDITRDGIVNYQDVMTLFDGDPNALWLGSPE